MNSWHTRVFRAVKLFCVMSLHSCQNLECTTQKVNPDVNYGCRLTRTCQCWYQCKWLKWLNDCKWWKQTASILELSLLHHRSPYQCLHATFQPFQSALKVNLGTKMHVVGKTKQKNHWQRYTIKSVFFNSL